MPLALISTTVCACAIPFSAETPKVNDVGALLVSVSASTLFSPVTGIAGAIVAETPAGSPASG